METMYLPSPHKIRSDNKLRSLVFIHNMIIHVIGIGYCGHTSEISDKSASLYDRKVSWQFGKLMKNCVFYALFENQFQYQLVCEGALTAFH